MRYSEFVKVYEEVSKTTKRLEKVGILSDFLRKISKTKNYELIYLIRGRVLPEYNPNVLGISRKLAIKAISKSTGISEGEIIKKFNQIGDLGDVAEYFVKAKKQRTLFSSKLYVKNVFENLKKIVETQGKGSINKMMGLVSEIIGKASGIEAKYITRTLLGDLRVGIGEGVLRDAIAKAFFKDEKEMINKIEYAFDMSGDFAIVFEAASKGKKELEKISLKPGKPVKVMLPVKVTNMGEAFRICGDKVAIEHKYDGFRMIISKYEDKIQLFTRRLEEVTKQFPDVVETIKKNVKAKSFILDSEAVGYDSKTKKYKPFEAVSQRIKRKYNIDKLIKKIPIEINVFDILYYNNKPTLLLPFIKRRKIVEKIIKTEKLKIRPSFQLVTDSKKKAEQFYKNALKIGEEGAMIKNINTPYQQGRRVGYIVKIKPEINDLDLVILGAEYGTGKRGGWFTSYIVGCKSGEKYLEVGKVSSGLKEKEEQGTTYKEMTKLIKPLIISSKERTVKIKPKIVVSVTYQNIQKSPSYTSGYALRFPRITHYRPDRKPYDIATIKEIKEIGKSGRQ